MDPRYDIPQRAAGSGRGCENSSPALGAQSRRRKMPPRPADFKLQIIIIGSRGVGKTSLMERFTDDTFCEACKSTVGEEKWCLRGFGLSTFCLPACSGAPSICWAKATRLGRNRNLSQFTVSKEGQIKGVVDHVSDVTILAKNARLE